MLHPIEVRVADGSEPSLFLPNEVACYRRCSDGREHMVVMDGCVLLLCLCFLNEDHRDFLRGVFSWRVDTCCDKGMAQQTTKRECSRVGETN